METNLLIDPCGEDPSKHITFNTEGEAVPLTDRGKVTIDIFNLNRPDLTSQREKSFLHLDALFINLEDGTLMLPEYNRLLDILLQVFDPATGQPFQAAQQAYCISTLQRKNKALYKILFYYKNYKIPSKKQHLLFSFLDRRVHEPLSQNIPGQSPPTASFKNLFIDKIIIRNFKGISKLEIKYPEIKQGELLQKNKSGESWLVILGENSVGKSSILQAILLTLAGQEYINTLKLLPSHFLQKGKSDGFIRIEFRDGTQPAELHFSKSSSFKATAQQPYGTILGYGSTRLMPDQHYKPEKATGSIRAKNLFDPGSALIDYKKWLFSLDKTLFDRVCLALKEMLMLKRSDFLIRDRGKDQILVAMSGNRKKAIPITQMSDGYKSVCVMAVDIMEKLMGENTTMDVAEGIVLIDEIGTHLHPKWRMKIVSMFRKIFPKVQFIVSTHDPLCLKGTRVGEVIVLNKTRRNKVVLIDNLPDPAALRADQLLASEFFGLSSTIDPEVEELFNEYYYLLAKPPARLSKLHKTRLRELKHLLKGKDQIGQSQRENMMYEAIDQAMVDLRFEPSGDKRIAIKASTESKLKSILNS